MSKIVLKLTEMNRWVPFLLVITLFVIPISPSLKSIFVILSALGLLLMPSYRRSLPLAFSQGPSIAALAFFLVAILACFWSSADYHTRLMFVEKYSKLLYLPIFAIGFCHRKIRLMGIYAFLAAMALTCILSIFKSEGDPGAIFHNHIVTSYMVTFAAYLCGLLAIRRQSFQRILFLLLLVLFTYQITFVNTGRTGYILYFILMTLLLIQSFSLKYILIGLLAFAALFAGLTYKSHIMSLGMHSIVSEWNRHEQGDNETSIGTRWLFHKYAKSLFLAKPFTGQGIGGFVHAVQRDHFFPERKGLLDPHSQYWLTAAEFGLLGLTALFCFFASLLIVAFKLKEMKPVLLGLLVSFFLANLTDSMLLYSAVGYLFIVFSALCLGEYIETRQKNTIVDSVGDTACPMPA